MKTSGFTVVPFIHLCVLKKILSTGKNFTHIEPIFRFRILIKKKLTKIRDKRLTLL